MNLEDYMLPCLNKQFFGIDCLGCGFQRAFIHLVNGEFMAAYNAYPAIFTLVIFAVFLILNYKFKFKNGRKINITFASINVLIIVISYFIKMKPLFIH